MNFLMKFNAILGNKKLNIAVGAFLFVFSGVASSIKFYYAIGATEECIRDALIGLMGLLLALPFKSSKIKLTPPVISLNHKN